MLDVPRGWLMTIDTHDGTDGRDHMADLIAEAAERATPEDDSLDARDFEALARSEVVQVIVDSRLASERANMLEDSIRHVRGASVASWLLGLAVGAGLALLLGGCTPVDVVCPPADVECDLDGSCWARAAGWPAWAQLADLDSFEGIIEPADMPGDCYTVAGTDAHVCVVDVECTELLGRPVDEVALTPSDCAAGGPWESAQDSGGQCWAVVDGVAVVVR